MKPLGQDFLSEEECVLLLRIARDSLHTYVLRNTRLDLGAYALTEALRARHGAFVTLRSGDGELRGCIGYTQANEALAAAVRDNAINAASRDPRFMPVRADELAEIRIEVSALCPGDEPGSPFILVKDVEEIVLGRDGLYLECVQPRGSGLLLPQVPLEQGWDKDAFLSGLCRKSGVPDGAWKRPGSKLYRFSAQVISESD